MLSHIIQTLTLRRAPRGGWDISLFFLLLTFMLFPVADRAVFGLPLYWAELALLLSLIALPLQDWEWFKQECRGIFSKERLVLAFAGLFLLGVMLSYQLNPHTLSGLGELKSFYFLPVLLFFTLRIQGNRPERLRLLFLAWLFGTMAAALASLAAASAGWLLYDGRLAGPYQSPNYLAMLVAPGVLMAGYFTAFPFGQRGRWWPIVGLALILPVLWLTRSYTAWIATTLAFGTGLWIGRKSLPLGGKSVVLLLFLSIGIFVAWESGSEKWESLISLHERSSFASRSMIWQAAVKISTDSFPLGIGTGRFQEVYLEYQLHFPPYLEWAVPTPHNLFLHFFLEGGVLAVLGWLGGVLSVVMVAKRILFTPSLSTERRSLVVLGLALLVFYLIDGLADTPYMKNDLALAVWGSLGLLWASTASDQSVIR